MGRGSLNIDDVIRTGLDTLPFGTAQEQIGKLLGSAAKGGDALRTLQQLLCEHDARRLLLADREKAATVADAIVLGQLYDDIFVNIETYVVYIAWLFGYDLKTDDVTAEAEALRQLWREHLLRALAGVSDRKAQSLFSSLYRQLRLLSHPLLAKLLSERLTRLSEPEQLAVLFRQGREKESGLFNYERAFRAFSSLHSRGEADGLPSLDCYEAALAAALRHFPENEERAKEEFFAAVVARTWPELGLRIVDRYQLGGASYSLNFRDRMQRAINDLARSC